MDGGRRAAVVGAGIGGLASAIALTRAGWEVTVFEVDPEHRPLGAGLSIWPNGVRALRWLGLDALVDESLHMAGGVRRADGKVLAGFERGAINARFGEPLLGLHRAELHEALLAGCGPERVRLDMRLRELELASGRDGPAGASPTTSGANAAELRFEDGTVERAELVVGADGLRSAVRAALLGDGEPRDAGIVAYRGVAALEGEVPAGEWWGVGSVAGLLPLRDGRAYWYFGAFGTDRPGRLEELAAAYPQAVAATVAGTPPEAVLVHQLYDRAPVDTWSRGAATLLGDAAHPMLPFIGQGAGAALEDAVTLGQALGAKPGGRHFLHLSEEMATTQTGAGVGEALAVYERARTARAARFVKESRRAAAIALPRSALTRRLRDTLLPLVPESTRLRQFATFLDWTP